MGRHSRSNSHRRSKLARLTLAILVTSTVVATGVNAYNVTDERLANTPTGVLSINEIVGQGSSRVPGYDDPDPVVPRLGATPAGGTSEPSPEPSGPEKDAERGSESDTGSSLSDDQQGGVGESAPVPFLPAESDTEVPIPPVDFDCDDFSTRVMAQSKYEENSPDDPNDIDGDRDGKACETFTFSDDNPSTQSDPSLPAPVRAQAIAPVPDSNCRDISRLSLRQHAEDATQDILAATGHTGFLQGEANRPDNPTSDHPRSLAVDFGTLRQGKAKGDEIAAYVLANQARLGVKYLLWQVKDHYDHVHISFVDNPSSDFDPRC